MHVARRVNASNNYPHSGVPLMSTCWSIYMRRSMIRLQYSLCPYPTTILQLNIDTRSLQTFMIYKCFCAEPIDDWRVSPTVSPRSENLQQLTASGNAPTMMRHLTFLVRPILLWRLGLSLVFGSERVFTSHAKQTRGKCINAKQTDESAWITLTKLLTRGVEASLGKTIIVFIP
jgi:hypothetical protein